MKTTIFHITKSLVSKLQDKNAQQKPYDYANSQNDSKPRLHRIPRRWSNRRALGKTSVWLSIWSYSVWRIIVWRIMVLGIWTTTTFGCFFLGDDYSFQFHWYCLRANTVVRVERGVVVSFFHIIHLFFICITSFDWK